MALNRLRVAASNRAGEAGGSAVRGDVAQRALGERHERLRGLRRAPRPRSRAPAAAASIAADDVVRRERRRRVVRGHLRCCRARARRRRARRRAWPPSRARRRRPRRRTPCPCSARIAVLPSAIADSGCSVPMPATSAATPPSSSCADDAPAQCSSTWRLPIEAGADEHLRDLADHLIADGEDHDLAPRAGCRAAPTRTRRRPRVEPAARACAGRARPQAEHRDAAEPQRAGERGGDRAGADDERGGIGERSRRIGRVEAVPGDIPQHAARQKPAQRRRRRRAPAARGSAVDEISGIVTPVAVAARRQRRGPRAPMTISGASATTSSQRYHFAVSPRMSVPTTSRSSSARAPAQVLDEIERAARDEARPLRELLLGRATRARAAPSGAAASSHIATRCS